MLPLLHVPLESVYGLRPATEVQVHQSISPPQPENTMTDRPRAIDSRYSDSTSQPAASTEVGGQPSTIGHSSRRVEFQNGVERHRSHYRWPFLSVTWPSAFVPNLASGVASQRFNLITYHQPLEQTRFEFGYHRYGFLNAGYHWGFDTDFFDRGFFTSDLRRARNLRQEFGFRFTYSPDRRWNIEAGGSSLFPGQWGAGFARPSSSESWSFVRFTYRN